MEKTGVKPTSEKVTVDVGWMRKLGFSGDLSLNNG